MAGPLARLLAQIIVPVVAILARALPAAYAQALQNARKSGEARKATTSLLRKHMSTTEALQILNLTEKEATPEAIQKVSVFLKYQDFVFQKGLDRGLMERFETRFQKRCSHVPSKR